MDSKRFPGKPLASIAGKPMIKRVYESAVACPEFKKVYIATNSPEITDLKLPGIYTDGIYRNGSERVAHTARIFQLSADEIVFNIQGDQVVFPQHIIADMLLCFEDLAVNVVTAGHKLFVRDMNNSGMVFVTVDSNGYSESFSREYPDRQAYGHVGIYAYRNRYLQKYAQLSQTQNEKDHILEQLRIMENGEKIKVVLTDEPCNSVNTIDDIKTIERMI